MSASARPPEGTDDATGPSGAAPIGPGLGPEPPPPPPPPRLPHRSSATPLALAYAALIVYASLYPFSDWRIVDPRRLLDWITAGWSPYWTRFDVVSNLFGYLPFGALVYGAQVRSGVRPWPALVATLLIGAGLSGAMEQLQNFLPRRVPSRLDWLLNVGGVAIGVLLAAAVHRRGYVDRWQVMRDRWFIGRSGGALALLLLWPVGLLFPQPVPLGLGHGLVRLPAVIGDVLDGTELAPWLEQWAATLAARPMPPLSPAAETVTIALGLLAPCLVAFGVAKPGWRRMVFPFGAAALAIGASTLSTALNFGPDHLFAWQTPAVYPAFMFGMAAALGCCWLPRRVAAGLGLVVLTALVAFVAQAPGDPYYADSLQAWEQGRFIRFHGIAQWVGWCWPFAAMLHLLARLSARPERE